MMKSIEQWDNWHRVFTATTEAQGVSNVLDLCYIPAMVAESQLFDAHQIYVVLLQTVKDSSLKAIVINYTNRQVQDIWRDITKIKANSLLQYITLVKLDD